MRNALALALLLPCLALSAVPASSQIWTIDATRSQAQFSVRKFWFVHARGTFRHLHGTLRRINTRFGDDLIEVDASIKVTDLVTDSPEHTRRALAADFFDAARYPYIHFDSRAFPWDELVTGGPLPGTLFLHGVQRPITFALLPSRCPGQPLDCAIRVHGTLSRRDFGMRAMPVVVGDKVHLSMRIFLNGRL